MKTNLRIIKACQNTYGFIGNNYLAYYTVSLRSIRPSKTEIAEKNGIYLHPGSNLQLATTLWPPLLQRLTHWATATVGKPDLKFC